MKFFHHPRWDERVRQSGYKKRRHVNLKSIANSVKVPGTGFSYPITTLPERFSLWTRIYFYSKIVVVS